VEAAADAQKVGSCSVVGEEGGQFDVEKAGVVAKYYDLDH